MYLSLRMTHNN